MPSRRESKPNPKVGRQLIDKPAKQAKAKAKGKSATKKVKATDEDVVQPVSVGGGAGGAGGGGGGGAGGDAPAIEHIAVAITDDAVPDVAPPTPSMRIRASLAKIASNAPEAKDMVPMECFVPASADSDYTIYGACTWCKSGIVDHGYWLCAAGKRPMCIECAATTIHSHALEEQKYKSDIYPQLCNTPRAYLTTDEVLSVNCECCKKSMVATATTTYTIRAKTADGKLFEVTTCHKCWMTVGLLW